MKYTKSQSKRHSLKNTIRLTAALLTLLLCVTVLYLTVGEYPVKAIMSLFTPSLSSTSTSTPLPLLTPTPLPTPLPTPTPTPTPTPIPAYPGKTVSNVIVVVDPGHGGRDPGTVSTYLDGFYEKEVTLDMGLRLKEKLEQSGIQVVMTREVDKELHSYWKEDVWARPRIANEVKATFFVSIHVNSVDITIKNGDTYNGTDIYHYGKNHDDFISEQFAQMMGEEIDRVTDTKYNGVLKEDFGVLRLSEMPALLVETAYITNREDHKRLESDKFREDMVDGIFNGTIRVLETMGAYKEDGVFKILVDQ